MMKLEIILAVLFSFIITAQANDNDQSFHLSVVRPFTEQDSKKLIKSFKRWESFPPCSNDTDSSVSVDLILYFSKSIDQVPSSIHDFMVKSEKSSVWRKCFNSFFLLGANLSIADDIYNPTSQFLDPNWNRGPNQQFIAINTWLEEYGPENGVFYYMEPDSVPIAKNWLSPILQAITRESRFTIFGGQYSGHNWDGIRQYLPKSLLNHINGNAIYNYTDTFYQELVETLEIEGACTENCKARSSFDVRLCELLIESYGVSPSDFASSEGVAYKHSLTITNLAGTVTLPQDVDAQQTVIVHGAAYFLN